MKSIEFRQIGIIHSPFKSPEGTPIQPAGAMGVEGKIEVFPDYQEGLEDLAGFSHIFLIYHFHLAKKMVLKVKPFLDDQAHGIFATRAPARPNPIGLSVVRLIKIDHGNLYIQDIDVVDKTPLLDIKPYVPEFDQPGADRVGWLEQAKGKVQSKKSDSRFR